MECLGLHNKPKAEVHPGHKLTGPKEERRRRRKKERKKERKKGKKTKKNPSYTQAKPAAH
jgi:hypothetical protein